MEKIGACSVRDKLVCIQPRGDNRGMLFSETNEVVSNNGDNIGTIYQRQMGLYLHMEKIGVHLVGEKNQEG